MLMLKEQQPIPSGYIFYLSISIYIYIIYSYVYIIYTYSYTSISISVSINIYIYMCVYMCVYMCIYIYRYIPFLYQVEWQNCRKEHVNVCWGLGRGGGRSGGRRETGVVTKGKRITEESLSG